MLSKRLLVVASSALVLSCSAMGQDQPLSVRTTVSTGYYNTYSRGETNQALSFVPLGAKFDVSGYYMSPDLLNFNVQPELNIGPQASEAGFQGGNGVQLQLTMLRKLIPITFHYSNLQVEDVYFGSLTQLSSYSLENRNKDLGVTVELKTKKLPDTIIDWGTTSVDSKSSIQGVPDYLSSGNHVNVDSRYEFWGWIADAFFHRQVQNSDLLEPGPTGTQIGSLQQTVLQYQGSARRPFLGDSEIYFDAGSQSTSSLLLDLPVNLSTHYAGANLRLWQRRRFRASIRANYSTNLATQLLSQLINSLGTASTVAPDQYALLPYSHGISSLNLSANTTLTLGRGFTLNTGAEHDELLSSDQNGPLNTRYTTATASLAYMHPVSWGSISGEYGREYGQGSLTGQSGTIQGDNYRIGVQKGRNGKFGLEGSVHGTDQTLHTIQPLTTHSIATEGAIGVPLFGDWSVRGGGGWDWSVIRNPANEFRTNGYIARFGVDHPRVQANIVWNDSISDSLPFFNQLSSSLGLDSILLADQRPIPSDYRATSVNLHLTPLRKLELTAFWTHSRQHLDGVLNNDFQIANVFITYHFRRIQIEIGFIRSNQVFAFYPDTLRQRYYIRFVRTARLL